MTKLIRIAIRSDKEKTFEIHGTKYMVSLEEQQDKDGLGKWWTLDFFKQTNGGWLDMEIYTEPFEESLGGAAEAQIDGVTVLIETEV